MFFLSRETKCVLCQACGPFLLPGLSSHASYGRYSLPAMVLINKGYACMYVSIYIMPRDTHLHHIVGEGTSPTPINPMQCGG